MTRFLKPAARRTSTAIALAVVASGAPLLGNAALSPAAADDAPTFSVSDESYTTEDSSGGTVAQFTVTRSGSTTASATVKIATIDGSAFAPGDYAAKRPTSLFFGVGQTTKDVWIPIKNDLVPEPTETFSVQLSTPVRATIADGTGVATVHDDDSSATPSFTLYYDAVIDEGDTASRLSLGVVRDGNLQGTSTVKYATADGTAAAPGDYAAKAPTKLTFRPGETFKEFTVTIKGDRAWELNSTGYEETFFVNLSAPTGGVIADGSVVITIVDDEH